MNPMTGFKDFEQFQIAFENGPIENRAGCSQNLLRALGRMQLISAFASRGPEAKICNLHRKS